MESFLLFSSLVSACVREKDMPLFTTFKGKREILSLSLSVSSSAARDVKVVLQHGVGGCVNSENSEGNHSNFARTESEGGEL